MYLNGIGLECMCHISFEIHVQRFGENLNAHWEYILRQARDLEADLMHKKAEASATWCFQKYSSPIPLHVTKKK